MGTKRKVALELILPWRYIHNWPVLLPFQADPRWRFRKEETVHFHALDSGVKSLLLFWLSSLCPKRSKAFLHFQLYFMNVSSLLWTKVFKGTAVGKRLQESTIPGTVAMLLELYETLLLGFYRKKMRNLKCYFGSVLYQIYIYSIFLGQRNLFAAVVFLKLK